jgi:hypothetical protein
MVSISCRAGLILFIVVCSFTCVAVGRGVATEYEVITKFQDSGGANGAVGVEARVNADAAGGDTSTPRSKHTEVSKLQVPAFFLCHNELAVPRASSRNAGTNV